jgi:hypothetical protein
MAVDQEAQPDDLRNQIEIAFETPADNTSGTDAAAAPENIDGKADAEVASAEIAPAESKGEHPTDPRRYADGTFKPTTEAAPEKVAAAKEIPSTDAAKVTEQPASTPGTLQPPAGWTAAEKAEWLKLSPVVQAAVSRREAEASQGGKQWSEQRQRYEAVLAPVAAAARANGLTTEDGLNRLLSAQNFLERDPVNAIKTLARSYGVDLAQLAGQPAAEGSAPVQPDIAAIVHQQVATALAPIQQRFQSEDDQRQQSTLSLIEQFASDQAHEHFDLLQPMMLAMLPNVRQDMPNASPQEWLKEAYDRAAYANPATRASLLAGQEAAAEAKRIADAKARAEKARKAGSSVNGAPNGAAAAVAHDSLRAELEAAYAGS